MKVTLRNRKLKDGRRTLYLDLYNNGSRRFEYLNLYLVGDRAKDKETVRLAEAIAAKRKLESVAADNDLPAPGRLQEDFVAYSRQIGEGQRALNTRLVWKHAIAQLTGYGGKPIPFARVTEDFLGGFRDYLLKELKQNSAAVYFAKIKSAVRRAVRKHILQRNPADEISIATEETDRVRLSLRELRALEKTECDNQARPSRTRFYLPHFRGSGIPT